MQQFETTRRQILCQVRDQAELRREVIEMRKKMWDTLGTHSDKLFNLKKDPGGITDIEFMVQYLILANAHAHPELIQWSDNIRQLESLQQVGLVSSEQADTLADIYRTLRDEIHARSLQELDSKVPINQFAKEREYVQHAWLAIMCA
jgi:glutamate-ammonia-ligase adenylyltransferase